MSDQLRNIAEAAIRAGEPRVQFVSPQLVLATLDAQYQRITELEAENNKLHGELRESHKINLQLSNENLQLMAAADSFTYWFTKEERKRNEIQERSGEA